MTKPSTDDIAQKPDEATPSRSSPQPLERGYGDEHGGFLVEPTEEEPRRPATRPDHPDSSHPVEPGR